MNTTTEQRIEIDSDASKGSTTARRLRRFTPLAVAAAVVAGLFVGAPAANAATSTVTETFKLTGCSVGCTAAFIAGAKIQLQTSTGALITSGVVPSTGIWKVSVKAGTSYRLWVNKQIGTSCTYGLYHYYGYYSFTGAATTVPISIAETAVC